MEHSDGLCPSPPCSHDPRCTSLISKTVKNHIIAKCEQFSEHFYFDIDFINSLVSRGVIRNAEKDSIRHGTTGEQCSAFLNSLIRKTWGHLRQFCHILCDREEEYLLREVFGFTKDASFIAPVIQRTNENVTLRAPNTAISEVKDSLQRNYRQRFYSVEVLGSKPFNLADHYIGVQLTEFPSNKTLDESTAVLEHQMFSPEGLRAEYKDDFRKVLVHGQTGCGKTALCLHTAAAWAMKANEETLFLEKYKLVISLEASVVLRYGIKGAIQQLLPRKECYINTVWHYLDTHGENCLIIIDDIDYILAHDSPDILKDVYDILEDNLFYGCSLLATTSRELPKSCTKVFDRMLSHNGFQQEQGLQFINSYFAKNADSAESLQNFLNGRCDDKRSLEEIVKRPIWNLALCQLWQVSGQVKGKRLNTTVLYSHMEDAVVGGKPTIKQQEEMKQLYRLCLYGVLHNIDIFEKSLLRQFQIQKRSAAFHFLTKKEFITSDFKEDFGFVIPHRTLLCYFAAKEISTQQCARSQWVLLNILLNTEGFSEVIVFLAGLLEIPNVFDLIFMHTLFHASIDIDSMKSDCTEAIKQDRSMIADLYKESRGYLLDSQDPNCSTTLLDMKMIRRKSFVEHVKDQKEISKMITRMAKDIRSDICSRCFTKVFHLSLSQSHKIVWLLRCYHEYSAVKRKPHSDLMKKLHHIHSKEIFISESDSPYDFLISDFSDGECCTLRIPYAVEIAHMKIMAEVLRQHIQRGKHIKKLNVFVDCESHCTERVSTKNKAKDIAKSVKDCLQKLHDRGLQEISFTGLLPEYAAQILPTSIVGSLEKLTIAYFPATHTWIKLLTRLSRLMIMDLCLETLDLEATQLLECILKADVSFAENIAMLHLGHRTRITRDVLHQYLLHGTVNVTFENLVLGDSMYGEVILDIEPISACRSLYVSYGGGACSTGNLLPSGLHLAKVRICAIYSTENIDSFLQDVAQDGVVVEDLQIDHPCKSGFILQALSHNREKIKHVQSIRLRHGTFSSDDVREFLMWQTFMTGGATIVLDSPSIDGYNMEEITLQKEVSKQKASVKFSYISGGQAYVSCLPAGLEFDTVSFSGLAMDKTVVWQRVLTDVSSCQVKRIEFHSNMCVNGDPCAKAFLRNILCLRGISLLVLRNFLFFETEMIDLLTISGVIPLNLEKVEVGHLKFDNIHIRNAGNMLKPHMSLSCRYPQEFSDLLPTSHQLEELVLTLNSDYSRNSCDERNLSYSPFSPWHRSVKPGSPSSIPESWRTYNNSLSPGSSLGERCSSPVHNRRRAHWNSPTQQSPGTISNQSNDTPASDISGNDSDEVKSLSPGGDSKSHKTHHSPQSQSGSTRSRKSKGSSHYNSTGTDFSQGTQPDSANTLMRELEKGFIDRVFLNLELCEEAACEDLLQALVDHSEILENTIGVLHLVTPKLDPKIESSFRQSNMAAFTTFVVKSN